jgi:secondary thiamine-phosphate synthase enzyme
LSARTLGAIECERAIGAAGSEGSGVGRATMLERRAGAREYRSRRAATAAQAPEASMRSLTRYFTMNVPARMDFVNITTDVERAVQESGVREGLCLVNAMHITASVFINDDEPGLHEDYKRWLEQLAPFDASPQRYRHNRTGEDNGDAHHKRQVMGREVVVAVTAGKLDFGPWEQIFYGEFDGRRPKRVLVKVIGD